MLFVGGELDGKRFVPVGKPKVYKHNIHGIEFIYVLRRMAVPGGVLEVYTPPDMKPEQVMRKLISGYGRPRITQDHQVRFDNYT